MPKFLENTLKAEYGAKSKVPYTIMNAMGVMHGSKETAKGRALDVTHAADQHPIRNLKHFAHPPAKKG